MTDTPQPETEGRATIDRDALDEWMRERGLMLIRHSYFADLTRQLAEAQATIRTLTVDLADARAEVERQYEPDQWWRVVYAEPQPDRRSQVWCETSDTIEAAEALKTCPGGGVIQRYWTQRPSGEWRPALDDEATSED